MKEETAFRYAGARPTSAGSGIQWRGPLRFFAVFFRS
jgi:hypothetical protein